MKKIVLTAFAVVAFSAVAIPNNSAVLIFKDCNKVASDKTSADEANREKSGAGCYSSGQYNKIRNLYYIECKLEMQKVEEFLPYEEPDYTVFRAIN